MTPKFKVGDILIPIINGESCKYPIEVKSIEPVDIKQRDQLGNFWYNHDSQEYVGDAWAENYLRRLSKLEKALK